MLPHPSTKLLKSSDTDIINRICISLKKAYDPVLSKFFIYQDSCFKIYFTAIISYPDVFIFYNIDDITKKLAGFVYFEIKDNTLQLKNIIIDHEFSGYRIAQNLIFDSINYIRSLNPDLIQFEAETFQKNNGALKWYKQLGMSVSKFLYWYDISFYFNDNQSVHIEEHQAGRIKIETDVFGFSRLLYNGQQIGSVIRCNYLVIYVILTKDLLILIQHFFASYPGISACLLSNTKQKLALFDKSVTLSGALGKLKLG